MRALALTILGAGSLLGLAAVTAVAFAPDYLKKLEPQLRAVYWRDVYAYAEGLQHALKSGDDVAAIAAGQKLFAAGKDVRLNEAPMTAIIQATDAAFASDIPQLRLGAARYVINLSPNDSYAWYVLGEENRREGRVEEAQKALVRALELRPFSYSAAAALVALYEKSGQRERAEETRQRFRDAIKMLLAMGTSFDAIFDGSDEAEAKSFAWFSGCRPNRIEINVPAGAKTGFFALPPAAGAEISLSRITALTDRGAAAQSWTASFGNEFVPVAGKYRVALGRDPPFLAQPAIEIAATGEGAPARTLRFEFSMCLPDSTDPFDQPDGQRWSNRSRRGFAPSASRGTAQEDQRLAPSILVWQGHGKGRSRSFTPRGCEGVDQDVTVEFPVTDIYVVLPTEDVIAMIGGGTITPPGGGLPLPIAPIAVSHAERIGIGVFKSRSAASIPASEKAVIGLYSGPDLEPGTSVRLQASVCRTAEYNQPDKK